MDKSAVEEKNIKLLDHIMQMKEPSRWQKSLSMTNLSIEEFKGADRLREVEIVYVVGHGTSLATAKVAESWFAHISGVVSQAMPAHQFSRYSEDFLRRPERTLVAGISCGGNTPSVVRCLELASASGARTVCLSGDGDIACASAAENRIITDCHSEGDEITAYTISHVFLLMGAYRLALLLGSKNGYMSNNAADYWNAQLAQAISCSSYLPELYEKTSEACRAMKKRKVKNFAVLGAGPNIGTMEEGALKISELSWLFGAPSELEDFSHGRFRELGPEGLLFIISPKGKPLEKTMDVLAGCSIAKVPSIVLTDEPSSAMRRLASYVIEMPRIQDEYLTPFLYVFPFWFYGYYWRMTDGELVGEVRHNLFAVDINFKKHFDESGEKIA
jgi:glucosamine 6-phosphate synthetase-like amidotransferase/phosphosugar isomerase protein